MKCDIAFCRCSDVHYSRIWPAVYRWLRGKLLSELHARLEGFFSPPVFFFFFLFFLWSKICDQVVTASPCLMFNRLQLQIWFISCWFLSCAGHVGTLNCAELLLRWQQKHTTSSCVAFASMPRALQFIETWPAKAHVYQTGLSCCGVCWWDSVKTACWRQIWGKDLFTLTTQSTLMHQSETMWGI